MAASVKLFQFFQKINNTIGICEAQPHQREWSRKSFFLIFAAPFSISVFGFLVFEANSMFDFAMGTFSLLYVIISVLIYLLFMWKSENVLKFIENCEKFIEKRVQSTAAYTELIKKMELFNKMFFVTLCASAIFDVIPAAPYTFVRYYMYGMGDESFYLFFPAWFPFNWRNPVGYSIAFLSQCVGTASLVSAMLQFLCVVFGSCWLFIFIVDDITKDLAEFNTDVNTVKQSHRDLTKRFCHVVQIYSDAKKCVMDFNQIYEYPLLSVCAWIMFSLAALLIALQFELWADHINILNIAILVFGSSWVITASFLLHEFGARMAERFELFEDELGQCDWYQLPIGIQRMYLIFKANAQQTINIHSFGGIVYERETFKKIITKAFSFFTTFRKFKP